MYLMVVTE